MNVIAHIALVKLRSFLNFSIEWKPANIVKHIASIIVFGGFVVGAYYSTRIATDYLLDNVRVGLFLFHRFLSMLLFVYFLSINVGNIIVSYATFYRSQEMSFYLTKPVSHTNLFIIKFFDNFFYSSTAFFLIALAVLLGYGSHFHMSWTFYFNTMLFMLMPFMLIAGCIAVMILLVIMRFAQKIGIRKMIAILAILYLESLFLYFSMTNPLRLVNQVWQHFPFLDQYFGYLDPPITRYFPNYWIAESLYWTMRGDSSFAFSYTILLVAATIVVFGLMVFVGKKLFYSSWLASLNFRAGRESQFPLLKVFSFSKPPKLEPQTSVLLKKEVWQFVREPSQWIHFGIISILVLTFVVSVANINLKQNLPFLQTVSYMVLLLFNAFLIASIALRFVFPSISIEGSNFWKVLSAPVKRSKVFWLKYLIAFLPILLISEMLVIFSHRSLWAYPVLIQSASVIMVSVAFAFVGLNIGAGSFFSDFKEKNPIRVASSQSATVTFLITIVYLTILVAIVFLPFNGYFGLILKGLPFDVANLHYAVAAFFVISVIIGAISLVVGLRALRRDY